MFAAKSHEPSKAKSRAAPDRATDSDSKRKSAANPMWHKLATRVQTKLSVGPPHDIYEQEADRVAGQVMRMTVPGAMAIGDGDPLDEELQMFPRIQRMCSACQEEEPLVRSLRRKPVNAPLVQRKCSACSAAPQQEILPLRRKPTSPLIAQRMCTACQEEEEEHAVQRMVIQREGEASGGGSGGGTAPSSVESSISNLRRSGGQPMSDSVLSFMEPRFGRDFSGVRIHTGAEPSAAAAGLQARAFTIGRDVMFGSGEYQPHTNSGRHLLAHELTHVVQQGGAGGEVQPLRRAPKPAAGTRPPPSKSREAPSTANTHSTSPRIQRSWLGEVLGSGVDFAGDVVEFGWDVGGDVVEGGAYLLGSGAELGLSAAGTVVGGGMELAGETFGSEDLAGAGRAVNQGLTSAGEATFEAVHGAGKAVNEVADDVGQLGNEVIDMGAEFIAHGGSFTIRDFQICPVLNHTFELPGYSGGIDLLQGAVPIGPDLFLYGSIGTVLDVNPSLQVALGPCWLRNILVVVDPFGHSSATATLSIGAGLGAIMMLQAGLNAEVGLEVIVPVGGIPVPVELPAAAIEGGVFGMGQASVVTEIILNPELGYTFPIIFTFDIDPTLNLGGALDLYGGAFGNLKILDKTLCSVLWPFWQYHLDGGLQFTVSLSSISSLGISAVEITGASITPIPFDQISHGLTRDAPKSDCPVFDRVCELLRALGLMPSQHGGTWKGHPPPPYPSSCNKEMPPYPEDAWIVSGALCRGVCGIDCAKSCVPLPDETRCVANDENTAHYMCTFRGLQECGSNIGCKNHDACYDWCSDHGYDSILDECHRWCDLECICDYDTPTCVGWALGNGPFDSTMVFYNDIAIGEPQPGPCPDPRLAEAMRRVQEISAEIAILLQNRPGDEANADRQIADKRRERTPYLIIVARAQNIAIEEVPGSPGVYRVASGNGRYLYGSIEVAWHLGAVSPSAYELGEQIGTAGAEMAVAGTAVQSRVHPYAADIDFDETISITVPSGPNELREAAEQATRLIIAAVAANDTADNVEFLRLKVFQKDPPPGVAPPPRRPKTNFRRTDVMEAHRGNATKFNEIVTAVMNTSNMNSFWRGFLADGRFVDFTKVIYVDARAEDGRVIIGTNATPDLNLAFLEDPGEMGQSSMAQFAYEMCCQAWQRGLPPTEDYLKGAKRAYNYFTVIGDLARMKKLEPVFQTKQAEMAQQTSVLDALKNALQRTFTYERDGQTRTGRIAPTQILTYARALQQALNVADKIRRELPAAPTVTPTPEELATQLEDLANTFRRTRSGMLEQNDGQAVIMDRIHDDVKKHISMGLKSLVHDIILYEVKPRCDNVEACKRRR